MYKIITDKTKPILARTLLPYILQYQKHSIIMSDRRLLSIMVATSHKDSRLISTWKHVDDKFVYNRINLSTSD